MSMSTGGSGGGPMAEINVTPLVDVMLVLLIIFMITAPIVTHKIKIDLPQPNPNQPPPDNPQTPIEIKIDQAGALYWNSQPVEENGLKAQMAILAQQPNPPELQIQAADGVQYEYVARVLADAKQYNLVKIGFDESGG